MLGFMDNKNDAAKIDLHWNAIGHKLLHRDKTLGTPFEKYIKQFTFARHYVKVVQNSFLQDLNFGWSMLQLFCS